MNADHPSGLRAGAGPVARGHPPFAVFAVPIPAARYQEHGRAEWRFARSAGTGGFPCWLWCGPTGARGRLGGWLWRVGAGCRGAGDFSRNCATTLAPAGAGSSCRVRQGRVFAKWRNDPPARSRQRAGARPAEGRAQVAADVVFAKLRNNPPAGQAPPVGSARAGARRGEGQAQVTADVDFAKLRNVSGDTKTGPVAPLKTGPLMEEGRDGIGLAGDWPPCGCKRRRGRGCRHRRRWRRCFGCTVWAGGRGGSRRSWGAAGRR